MKIINNKFQKITVAIIFSWLIFFVLIPNLLVLTVSFLTRDGSDFYALPFTLDNYANLFNPLYAQVVWNSLYMSGIATIICLLIGYPLPLWSAKLIRNIVHFCYSSWYCHSGQTHLFVSME